MYSVCGDAPFRAQPRALLDAEAMLLVDDRQAQPIEIDAFGQQRVRSDRERRFAAGELFDRGAPRARALAAEDGLDADAERQQQRREFARVLPRQQLGRRHQRRLQTVAAPPSTIGRGGDQRLAAADVALQEPVHRHVASHVVPDLSIDAPLRAGQRKGKRRLEALE